MLEWEGFTQKAIKDEGLEPIVYPGIESVSYLLVYPISDENVLPSS